MFLVSLLFLTSLLASSAAEECEDTIPTCKKLRIACHGGSEFIKTHCSKTCGDCAQCNDSITGCETWLKAGLCEKKKVKALARKVCAYSCGYCKNKGGTVEPVTYGYESSRHYSDSNDYTRAVPTRQDSSDYTRAVPTRGQNSSDFTNAIDITRAPSYNHTSRNSDGFDYTNEYRSHQPTNGNTRGPYHDYSNGYDHTNRYNSREPSGDHTKRPIYDYSQDFSDVHERNTRPAPTAFNREAHANTDASSYTRQLANVSTPVDSGTKSSDGVSGRIDDVTGRREHVTGGPTNNFERVTGRILVRDDTGREELTTRA